MIQSLGLLLALSGASGAYGLPDDMTVAVGPWGAFPRTVYRAGDIGLTFSSVVPGGDLECRFTINWADPDADLPALGAPIVISDAFGPFRTYRVSNVQLVVFYQGESPNRILNIAQVSGQGYAPALAEKRYGNASTPGATAKLSSDAVTFPEGTLTGNIIATAVGQLGNGIVVAPGTADTGVSLTEQTPDLRGRSAQDIINEYLPYGGAYSWQVTGEYGVPTFRIVTKGQNGAYSGSLPDIGAGDGLKLTYQIADIETEFAVEWRDPTQHDAVEVSVTGGNAAALWPSGIGFSRQKWVDAGNSVRSQGEALAVGAQYAGNALGIEPSGGEVSIPWPLLLTGPNGEQYPPWRIPANAYLNVTNMRAGAGYCKAESLLIVKSEWRGSASDMRAVLTLGTLQTEMKRMRQSQVVTHSRIGTAVPGVNVNQAPQWSFEKGASGGYPPLDGNTVPTSYNETRVPPANLPVRANHKSVVYPVGDGQSVISDPYTTAPVEVPFTCHLHRIKLLADESGSITVQVQQTTYDKWVASGPASLTNLTGAAAVTITSAFGAKGAAINVALQQGDLLAFKCTSVTSIQRVSVNLSFSIDPEEHPDNWDGVTGDPTKSVPVTGKQVL